MKIVIDSNVLISGLISRGVSSRVLDICIDKHSVYISEFIISEVIEKLENKINIPQMDLRRINKFLTDSFIFISPQGDMPDICRDKDDNNILFLSHFINANLLISGDKDLSELKVYNEILIITPREFLENYSDQK